MKEGHSAWVYVFLPLCSVVQMPACSRNSTVFYQGCLAKGLRIISCKKQWFGAEPWYLCRVKRAGEEDWKSWFCQWLVIRLRVEKLLQPGCWQIMSVRSLESLKLQYWMNCSYYWRQGPGLTDGILFCLFLPTRTQDLVEAEICF